jgi:CIC family chloride channel protein
MSRPTRRQARREERIFLALAVIIGIYSGCAVVCFRLAIEWFRIRALGTALVPTWPRVVLAPAAIGLAVALLVVRFFPAARGSGVNQTKAALYVYDGYISFRTVLGKFLTAALAIGSGQSLGPEDPSLQIGAGLASALGRRLELSRDWLRYIAPVGAAAGLAAAFNAPITAVLFVIEEVVGRWTAGVLGAVVLAAVSSVVTEQWFLGDQPLFRVPAFHLEHPSELVAYALLGLVGGALSLVFVKLVAALRPRLRALPPWTWYVQPALAGLLIGAAGTQVPQIMGAGYESIVEAMHGQFGWRMLAALAVLKLLATTLSFVSGTPGGLFAPTLFIGAMLGAAVCGVERIAAPGLVGPMSAYALVGMGTTFAGILRAPMTSVFMIIEISGNYSIIAPLMVSNTISYLVSRRFQRVALFDILARQDGTDLPSMEEERESEVHSVEDAMRSPEGIVLDGAESVDRGVARAEQVAGDFFLVRSAPGVWAGASRDELLAFRKRGDGRLPLGSLAAEIPRPYLYPDQPMDFALRVLHQHPFMPVVHRADPGRLVGLLTLADAVRVYDSDGDTAGPPRDAAGPLVARDPP